MSTLFSLLNIKRRPIAPIRSVTRYQEGTGIVIDDYEVQADPDYEGYIMADGSVDFTGNQSLAGYNLTNVGDIELDSLTAAGASITSASAWGLTGAWTWTNGGININYASTTAFQSYGNSLNIDTTNTTVGIGQVPSDIVKLGITGTKRIGVYLTSTGSTATYVAGLVANFTISRSANSANHASGLWFIGQYEPSANVNMTGTNSTGLYAVNSTLNVGNTNYTTSVAEMAGNYSKFGLGTTGTTSITLSANYYSDGWVDDAGGALTATTHAHFYANNNTIVSHITNSYGLYIAGQTRGVTANYGIVLAGNCTAASTTVLGSALVCGASKQLALYYDGTQGVIDCGSITPSDLDIYCGANKTIELQTVVYDDLRVPALNVTFVTTPTAVDYDVNGGGVTVRLYAYAKGDEGFFVVQLPHTYQEGGNISVHIHWTPGAYGGAESGKYVGWKLLYSWANIDGAFGNMTTADLSDVCDGVNHRHQMTPVVSITGTSKSISSMLLCKVTRTDTGTDDTWASAVPAAQPILLEVDFHFPINTMGSRAAGTK